MILIEEPSRDDAVEIFFVQRQTWHESYIDYLSHEEIEKRFTDSPKRIQQIKELIEDVHNQYFIAKTKGKIIGFISLTKIPRNKIVSLYVIEQSQGQGVGKELFQEGIKWFKDTEIFIRVLKKNKKAQKFYEKMGAKFIRNLSPEESNDIGLGVEMIMKV
jgi:ribosomal protein S18 acetylase RimI-like enzyme